MQVMIVPVIQRCIMYLIFMVHQQKQLKEAVKVISSGSLLLASYLTVVGDERFYANQLMPLLQRIVGAETAHVLAVKVIGLGLVPLNRYQDPASLVSIHLTVCSVSFSTNIRMIINNRTLCSVCFHTGSECLGVTIQEPHWSCCRLR